MTNKNNSELLTVYLDQNKWIDLARAYHNHPDGQNYQHILKKIRHAIDNKITLLPLSFYHFVETQKVKNKSRQKRLAEAMSILSQGWGIALVDNIIPGEIQISGANLFGFTPPPSPKIFKKSLPFTLGIDLVSVAGTIDDPIATSENFINFYNSLLTTPQILKLFLTGDALGESEFEKAMSGHKNGIAIFAELTKSFRSRLKPIAKSQAQHKRGYTLQLVTDLREIIDSALNIYGKSTNDIVSMGEDKVVEFIESIPTLDVEAEMVSRRNVNWNREIDENDWADIRFLMAAIPYCDVVITENYWKDLAQKSRLDKKYSTTVLSDLCELEGYL